MRNNKDRLGLQKSQPENADPVPVITKEEQDVAGADFSFIAANDVVELPSQGLNYPEGHRLRTSPVIELKQMTAREEDILTNDSYIKEGVVVDRLLYSLLSDKTINLDELLVGDKNALIIQARRSAYGDEYKVSTFCRTCLTQNDVGFDLGECAHSKTATFVEGVESTEGGTYKVEVPMTKAIVEMKFLTSEDEKDLVVKERKYKKNNVNFSLTIESFKKLIVSVNGETNCINSFVENMPVRDSRFLKKIIKEVPPNVELLGEFVCENCGANNNQEVPITYRFFWPDF
jgi:hypothetical protein